MKDMLMSQSQESTPDFQALQVGCLAPIPLSIQPSLITDLLLTIYSSLASHKVTTASTAMMGLVVEVL
jgi:hypothetical protein